MVAALEERKGILDFVAAARVAAAANPNVDFAVVGDGPLRERAESLVAQHGLAGRFHFLGHRGDVRRILCAFDVFVQPSHHEGLSLVMLEALAAGLPMVTTRVDGVSDVLPEERGALCADVGDVGGLGRAMARAAADDGLRGELVAVSQRRVLERFTVEAMYQDYVALYRRTGVPL
jgi:glycosyltransferase involved in cell wall biosynthesis